MAQSKLKLAYISPFPPEKTGVAYYSKELVEHLVDYYDVYLVLDQEDLEKDLKKRFSIVSIEEFRKNFRYFDRVIYNIGNSPYHRNMIPLLEEIPGVVILHDLYLGDLINWLDSSGFYPGIMNEETYYSHGWYGLIKKSENLGKFIIDFPLNARVINNALGVILHNHFSLQTLKKFYSLLDESKFAVVPHLRNIEDPCLNKNEKDFFTVASIGFISHIKAPEIVLESFARSQLSKKTNSELIFVGEPIGEISSELYNLAEKYGIKEKLKITGFVNDKEYKEFLCKTDIAIQLRRNSRSETSGVVLDLLARGIPTIVNKHGSLAELPEDAVFFVSEEPDPDEIAKAIDTLAMNVELKKKISENARTYLKNYHSPEKVVPQIFEAIERFYKNGNLLHLIENAINEIKQKKNNGNIDNVLKIYAKKLVKEYVPPARNKTLYVDVSAISINDLGTGIQRVVKAQLKGLLTNPPEGYRVEPVRIVPEIGWELRFARDYTKGFLKLDKEFLPGDTDVILREPGIYFCPDLYYDAVINAANKGLFKEMKSRGIKIAFLVHDMLPVEFPNYFPYGTSKFHSKWAKIVTSVSDMLICISEATAEAVKKFMKENGIENKNLRIEVLHLGSDIKNVKHKSGISDEEIKLLEKITSRPFFLMVSTIEPRKGHRQTIKAFELLWKKGLDVNLVIVGKEGWMVEDLIKYIKNHPELNERLFWLGYVSDDFLEKLYKSALATIMASEGEGFGLSIIESAHYGTPIIARDIAVFREVAKDGAFYFKNSKDPKVLADSLEEWLALYRGNKHPKPDNIQRMTWKEHVEKLKELLLSLDPGKN